MTHYDTSKSMEKCSVKKIIEVGLSHTYSCVFFCLNETLWLESLEDAFALGVKWWGSLMITVEIINWKTT